MRDRDYSDCKRGSDAQTIRMLVYKGVLDKTRGGLKKKDLKLVRGTGKIITKKEYERMKARKTKPSTKSSSKTKTKSKSKRKSKSKSASKSKPPKRRASVPNAKPAPKPRPRLTTIADIARTDAPDVAAALKRLGLMDWASRANANPFTLNEYDAVNDRMSSVDEENARDYKTVLTFLRDNYRVGLSAVDADGNEVLRGGSTVHEILENNIDFVDDFLDDDDDMSDSEDDFEDDYDYDY